MKTIVCLLVLFLAVSVQGQISEPLAMNSPPLPYHLPDTAKKTFSNSEPAEILFLVNPNLKENKITIETNFKGYYKVRIIDYYAGSRKVYKNQKANMIIDVAEFEKGIFIMNITDSQNNLLTSQVVNLKRRHL